MPSDDETKPEAYPDHDAEYRQRLAAAKLDLNEALAEYPPEIQVAAAMEVVSRQVDDWTYGMFENRQEDE